MTTDTVETRGFEAEVSKLLKLMIHSLYSNRDIFLRELISNASDACDKRRFQSLKDSGLGDSPLEIRVAADTDASTLIISDSGIGMSRDEVIANLGTLARSGTAEFLQQLTADKQQDAQLIGQFGVGFYSAFMVASCVDVYTRRADLPADAGVHWSSEGEGEYRLEDCARDKVGTEIVLTLREDAKEFAQDWKLRELIRRYSDHVAFPILMRKPPATDADKEVDVTEEWEAANEATALWQRPRQEVNEAEYQAFYRHVCHDFRDPLDYSHNKVEGALEYTSLLYLPAKAPMDLYHREGVRGLKLYVQRVFIMDDAEQFLPLYLRFIKGVVDVPSLSLNVSRELLQDDGKVTKIRHALTKRVLSMLSKLAKDEDKYTTFWHEFGSVLKEGVGEDHSNREKVAALLRFYSTASDDKENVSLDQYIERMPAQQKDIYYLLAENHSVAKASPHLEALKKKGFEVLLLSDRIDEWLTTYLLEFKDKKLVNIGRGELDLGDEEKTDESVPDNPQLIERIQQSLKDEVDSVRATGRLVDSPACVVLAADALGPQLRRLLEAQGEAVPEQKPVFEVNLAHPLLRKLEAVTEQARFDELVGLLLDQALLAEGQLPRDSQRLAQRLGRLLMQSAAS